MFDFNNIKKTFLIIDKDGGRRSLLLNFFSKLYICEEADSLEIALEKIRCREFSVILAASSVLDLMDFDLIAYLQTSSPRSVPVFISDVEVAGNTVRAFRAGAFEVIQKPFELKKIEDVVEKAFNKYEIRQLKDNYQYHLEELVAERTAELDQALEEVEKSYLSTLKALIQALETRDFETHGHSERVVTFSLRLGYELGLNKEQLRNLELGALLHDIGKIGVPDAILRKPARLTETEWEQMRLHPLHGQKILRNIPFLEGAARIVSQHHEKWDGTGYPYKLSREDIDIGARIFSAVDAFDAMVSNRVYRQGCSYEEALEELERCAGSQFDPRIIEAFKNVPKEDWSILRNRSLDEGQNISSFQAVVSELFYSRQKSNLIQ